MIRKKRWIKKSVFALLLITSFTCMFGQTNKAIGKITISSPNAASLGKYGDIPVSYHTGIPNVSIPIYNVKNGPISLPISLSYHASGLKVQEQASWVGAGWTLNAGGVITRTVVGAPDDKGLYAASTDKGHFSDYGYNSYLFSQGPTYCDPNPNGNGPAFCPPGTSYAPQDALILNGKIDGEPDLYFFNFNGYSGKFYFNDDRTPILVPQSDFKIVPIYPGNAVDWRGITGFIITTPDGVKYYFGKNQLNDGNPDAIELTYNVTTQSNFFTGQGASSSWFLNRIVSADDLFEIKLIYVKENFSYYTLAMFPIPSQPDPGSFAYNLEYDLDKNFIDGVRLSKIVFSNGEVNFNTGALRQDLGMGANGYTGINDVANTDATLGGRVLDNITIQSASVCKKYKLFTDYFVDNSSLTGTLFNVTPGLNLVSDKYRLRLDSLQESSCDNLEKIPPHKFSYFSETVPRKLSFGVDHWGFANGVVNNQTLIPTYSINNGTTIAVTNGADRESNWPAMRGGALQKIVYPTGGNTLFEFEPNSIFSTNTTTQFNPIHSTLIRMFGQSAFSQKLPFTGGGNIQITANNSSLFQATFVIKDVNNNTIFSLNIPENTTNYIQNITLPQGSDTTILSLPTNALSGGAKVDFHQLQTVTSESNRIVGGLRIKKITNNDAITTKDVVTNYTYNFSDNNVNGRSSGLLFSRPAYLYALRSDVWGIINSQTCSPIGCFNCFGSNAAYYKSPSSIRPMASTQGNHIGYGEVYVSQTNNGKSGYRYYSTNGSLANLFDPPLPDVCFRTLSTFCDPGIGNSPAPPEPFDPMRGELAFDAHYSNQGQLITSNAYYPSFELDSIKTPGIVSKFFITGYQAAGSSPYMYFALYNDVPTSVGEIIGDVSVRPVGLFTFTEYNLQSARKVRDSVVTKIYDAITGNYQTNYQTTYYKSKFHFERTQVNSISSKGEILTTKYKNAFDFRISNYNVADQLLTYYLNISDDFNYLSTALAGVTVPPSDPHYYWQRLNIYVNFRYKKAIHRQAYINYRRQNFTDSNNVYTLAHNAAKSSADPDLKPIFELQDYFQNPVLEQSQFKNGKLLSSVFTDYMYSAGNVGPVYLSKTRNINLATPSNSFATAMVTGNSLVRDSRYVDESTVKFSNGNLIELKGKDGITTTYVWGYRQTMPVAQITGAGYADVLSALGQTDQSLAYLQILDGALLTTELNKIRNNLSISKPYAQVFTYTYSPLIGMVTQTDPNGRTSSYEYDVLHRLKLIRDQDGNILKTYEYKYLQAQ